MARGEGGKKVTNASSKLGVKVKGWDFQREKGRKTVKARPHFRKSSGGKWEGGKKGRKKGEGGKKRSWKDTGRGDLQEDFSRRDIKKTPRLREGKSLKRGDSEIKRETLKFAAKK